MDSSKVGMAWRWAIALLSVAACAPAPDDCGPGACDGVTMLGGPDDPVVRLAQTALPASVEVTITAPSRYYFTQGLITYAPLFNTGQTPSAALLAYLAQGGIAAGNAQQLASALGLTVGVNAFLVETTPPTRKQTVSVLASPNQQLYFLARVGGAVDDFVAAGPMQVFGANGFLQTVSVPLLGYDPNDGPGGTVVLGNGTTGVSVQASPTSAGALAACPLNEILRTSATLYSDDFNSHAFDPDWPSSAGYEGEFGGDWYTDGATARLYNPNWGGASATAPIPTISGMVSFVTVCPASGSTVALRSDVLTDYSDPTSDTTLVLYYFDRFHALIDIDTSFPLGGSNNFELSIPRASIPSGTRRIAVVPMAFFAAAEQGGVYYNRLELTYLPNAGGTLVASDGFTSFGPSAYGDNQPTGWAEFGGDWFVMPTLRFATLWNSTWGGDQSQLPPIDTGLVKAFPLNGSPTRIDAQMFAASTFTDPTSFVRLRLVFGSTTGPAVESSRLAGQEYADVSIGNAAVPAGANTVYVIVNSYLGAAETSSLYVDDVQVRAR